MTIQSEIHRNDYIGAGSTDTFIYGYKIFASTDLVVVQRDTADVETTLILNTDYTVTGVGDTSGGTIVLTAGNLTLNYALAIVRRRPLKQETDIRNQGDFNREQLEDAYDNVVMQTQTLQEQVDRALLIPDSITGVSNALPIPVASQYLRWNSAADALETVTLTNSVVGTIAAQDADSVAITGGAINGTTIGGVASAVATFSQMNTSDAQITGGDITGITDLAVADGGTGASTAQAAIDTLTAVSAATDEHVLTKDTSSGNAIFKVITTASSTPSSHKQGDKSLATIVEASTTTITIDGGFYHVTNGTKNTIAQITGQLTFTVGSGGSNAASTNLSASVNHYLYIDYSALTATDDGEEVLVASDILNSTTAPTFNHAYGGWYNGSDRCIGYFYSNSSSQVEPFYQRGNKFSFEKQQAAFLSGGTSASYAVLTPSPIAVMADEVHVAENSGIARSRISIDGTNIFFHNGDGAKPTTGLYAIPLNGSSQFYYLRFDGTEGIYYYANGFIFTI